MTIPSLPEENPRPHRIDETEEMPPPIPQPLMTAVSVILVLALILGSASAVVALTDWGLGTGALVGLIVALVLIVLWLRMPARATRR